MSQAPKLTRAQHETLRVLLDTLVPPSADGARPGAGELGLADAVAEAAGLGALLGGALDALAERAGRGGGFGALDQPERELLLRDASALDAGVLRALVFQTFVAYYEQPRVLEALGLEPRPPHPLGYSLEAGDPRLLEPVRRRAKLYRDA